MAALAALTGLFSKHALDKLREVFDTLFRLAPDSGDATRADSIANPQPHIDGLRPSAVIAHGMPVTVRVSGSGFVHDSTVRFGGNQAQTTYLGPGTLAATLNPAAFPTGPVLATVSSPQPGGGVSNPLPLLVQQDGQG